MGRVHLGTQTEKCGWTVTPRQLVVKGCLSVCALIWLIVFSQASSASVCLFFLLFSAAKKSKSSVHAVDVADPSPETQIWTFSGLVGKNIF